MTKGSSRSSSHGRVVGRGHVVIEERMLGDECESQGMERRQEQFDHHNLRRDEEAAKLFGVHFFLTAAGLGLGG
jgi:hypothetical protein